MKNAHLTTTGKLYKSGYIGYCIYCIGYIVYPLLYRGIQFIHFSTSGYTVYPLFAGKSTFGGVIPIYTMSNGQSDHKKLLMYITNNLIPKVSDIHDDLRRQISALTDYNPQISSDPETKQRRKSSLMRRPSRVSRRISRVEEKELIEKQKEVKKLVQEEGAETGNVSVFITVKPVIYDH